MDKKGKFVDGLGRESFELVVDGKPRPISFLERVTAGSATVRGRTVVFFIDDFHLSPSGTSATQSTDFVVQ